MASFTRNTNHRRCAKRGYTLVEAMIASTLLSVSVVAISGAINASYAHDQFARDKQLALASGAQLLDELTALPIDSATAGNPSIMTYSTYSDEGAINELTSVVSTTAPQAAAAAVAQADSTDAAAQRVAKRKVSVKRRASSTGSESATGDFALVAVEVKQGEQAVTIRRMVTAAEATAGK